MFHPLPIFDPYFAISELAKCIKSFQVFSVQGVYRNTPLADALRRYTLARCISFAYEAGYISHQRTVFRYLDQNDGS